MKIEKTIKLSEIKRLNIKPNEILCILYKKGMDMDVADIISVKTGCIVVFVEDFNDFMVITKDKVKK